MNVIVYEAQHDAEHLRALSEARLLVMKFGAPWCAPCKQMEPVLIELAERRDVYVMDVNIDLYPEMGRSYAIRTLPTFKLIRNGVVLITLAGPQSLKALESAIENVQSTT